jgi:hypothetical protein
MSKHPFNLLTLPEEYVLQRIALLQAFISPNLLLRCFGDAFDIMCVSTSVSDSLANADVQAPAPGALKEQESGCRLSSPPKGPIGKPDPGQELNLTILHLPGGRFCRAAATRLVC